MSDVDCKIKRSALNALVMMSSALVDDIILNPMDDGKWEAKFVDPAHVCMMRIELPNFVVGGERVPIALDLDKMKEILKTIKDKELSFNYERISPSVADVAGLMTFSTNFDGCEIKMGRCMTACVCDPKVPNLMIPVEFLTTPNRLKKAISLCVGILDHVRICYDSAKSMVTVEASNDNEDMFQYCMSVAHPANVPDGIYASLFPLDYLNGFMKAVDPSIFPDMIVKIGMDLPIRMELLSGDGMRATYILAPRIEND